jgi:hypothetical protein
MVTPIVNAVSGSFVRRVGVAAVLLGLLVPVAALAQSRGGRGSGGHHGPPPEAIEACEGRSDGSSCSVAIHGDSLDGTCRVIPTGESACVPEGMGPPMEPPAEAFEACDGGREGDECTIVAPFGELDGECVAMPDRRLVCAPDGMGPPPQR